MRGTRTAAVLAAVTMLAGTLAACGGEQETEKDRGGFSAAADLSTCTDGAKPADTPYGDGFPQEWPFPAETVVYHAEDRGGDGTIVTGISSTPFKQVLAFLNGPVADRGFTVEKGETEAHDAEAEWDGKGFRGRWAIRESADCPGETVIQVLSAKE